MSPAPPDGTADNPTPDDGAPTAENVSIDDLKAAREQVYARYEDETISIDETCAILDISKRTYYRLIDDGVLTRLMYRGRPRVLKAQVHAYLRELEEQRAAAHLKRAAEPPTWPAAS